MDRQSGFHALTPSRLIVLFAGAIAIVTIAILFGVGLFGQECTDVSRKNLKAILKAVETRDFVGWTGLPDSCPPSELFDDIPVDLSNRPLRSLGEAFEASVFVVLEMNGYYRPTASIRNDELVLFDAMNPELLGGFARLREDLGEPVARLDWSYGTLEIPTGEWVYPKRGITVFLNTLADKVLHIAVYPSTDLGNYRSTLRPSLRKELRPFKGIDEQG